MSLFKKMKSPLSKDDLQEPKNLDSLNLLTMSEDYKFELEWWNRMLFGLYKKQDLPTVQVVSAYDLNKLEEDFLTLSAAYNFKVTQVDCRTLTSHSDFCKMMRGVPEYSAVVLSHVTEIPFTPEQKNIGWAINSLKDSSFFGQYPMSHICCLLTYLPDELVENPFYGALRPMPGGLKRFDNHWNSIINL